MAANDIILDSGYKTYNLYFEELNVRIPISFNPNDPSILTRLEEATKKIEMAVNEIDTKNSTEGELIEKIKNIVCEQIDYIFHAKVGADMFTFCHPLATRPNGETYMIYVINAISKVIKRDVEAAERKAAERMSKHLDKYRKKK